MKRKLKKLEEVLSEASFHSIENDDSVEEVEAMAGSQLSGPGQTFRNLYWSRLVSLQLWQMGDYERWPMEDDLDEEQLAQASIEVDEEAAWEPFFDPEAFNQKHKPLGLKEYALDQDEL